MKRICVYILAAMLMLGCSSSTSENTVKDTQTNSLETHNETVTNDINNVQNDITISENDTTISNDIDSQVPSLFSYNQNGEIVGSAPEIIIEDNLAYNKEENIVYLNKDLTNEQTAVDYLLSLLHITAKDEEDGDLFPNYGYIKEENSYIIAVSDTDGNNTQMMIPVIKADAPKPIVDESTYTYEVIVTDNKPTKKVVNEFMTVNITLPSGYEFLQPIIDSYGITKEYEDGIFTIYAPSNTTFLNYSGSAYLPIEKSISYQKADEITIDTLFPQIENWSIYILGDPNKPIWNYNRYISYSATERQEILRSAENEIHSLRHIYDNERIPFDSCSFDGQIIACSLIINKDKFPNLNFSIDAGDTYAESRQYYIIDFTTNTSLRIEYNEYENKPEYTSLSSRYFDANNCMLLANDGFGVIGIANFKEMSPISYHVHTGEPGTTPVLADRPYYYFEINAQTKYKLAK